MKEIDVCIYCRKFFLVYIIQIYFSIHNLEIIKQSYAKMTFVFSSAYEL